jgi:hypothetical protein
MGISSCGPRCPGVSPPRAALVSTSLLRSDPQLPFEGGDTFIDRGAYHASAGDLDARGSFGKCVNDTIEPFNHGVIDSKGDWVSDHCSTQYTKFYELVKSRQGYAGRIAFDRAKI